MSDLDVLRDLAEQLHPPDYNDLVGLARTRRRRSATAGVVAAAAVLVVTAGIVQTSVLGEDRGVRPAPAPAPTTSPQIDEETLERIRRDGAPISLLDGGPEGAGVVGPQVQLYCAGGSTSFGPGDSPCDRFHPYDPAEEQAWALEVIQGDRSAFFEVLGTPLVLHHDEDSVLVVDGTNRAQRFRLLQPDGTAVELQLVAEPAPATPGPDVVLIQAIDTYRNGMVGADGPARPPYLLDEKSATLRLVDVPSGVEWWGSNVDEALWGGAGCLVTWLQPDGTFAQHDTGCSDPEAYTNPEWNAREATRDWLGPGRMVAIEWGSDGWPDVVHASLDRGTTWARVEVDDNPWRDQTLALIENAVSDVLQELEEQS